ncbi:MAG: acyl-CoA thioesterase [Flavobacteriales bacterium]|nr:acyl-CoA thioesterase [Flavobacteriales bacterium]MCB9193765.1 acyl-CoA thioesterase [Flavobacteriales bacterium]
MDPRLVQRIEVPIAWGEQDLFGHLNNVVFLRYFESARMHYLERIGVLALHRERNIGVILAHTAIDFRKPVVWPQTLTVRTGTTRVGNTSFTMGYAIHDEAGDLVAEGNSVQVMYDYDKAAKMPIPMPVQEAIAKIQRSL